MLYILVILWQITFADQANNSSICVDKMKEAVEMPLLELIQTALPYYALSGDWLERFGYYDRCLGMDNGYSSVAIDASPLKGYYGFCHTDNCTADDFNSKEGQEQIRLILNKSGIADILQINITAATMVFHNPKTYLQDLQLGTYITCAILIVLFFMILLDPILRFKKLCSSSSVEVSPPHTRPSPLGDEKQSYTPTTIVKDFSIILNYNKIMNLKTIDPNLAIFNGIRAISFLMVIYGHVNEMVATSTFAQEIMLYFDKWRVVFLYDMMYAVDVFFWLGGFFLGYVMCEERKAKAMGKNPASVFLAILHRLLRIWPCYLLCIAVNSYIIPYLGSGPRWFLQEGGTGCPGGAWKNALFIDNFYEDWKLCFGWGWYLTCDIQLFLTCLIPVLIYSFNYKVFSKILIILMIIGTLGWGLYLNIHYDFLIPARNTYNKEYYYKYYVSTYARAPPYFLGLLIGILYRELKSYKNGKVPYLLQFKNFANSSGKRFLLQLFCYGIGSGIIAFLLCGWKKDFNSGVELVWPKWFQYIYHALCRFLFTFGLTLIVLPNLIGAYDIFNRKFMNNALFKFMAKISFCMYLVHLMFIIVLTDGFYETPSFIQLDIVSGSIFSVVISIVFGLFLALLVELPFSNLDTRLMKIIHRPPKKTNTLLD